MGLGLKENDDPRISLHIKGDNYIISASMTFRERKKKSGGNDSNREGVVKIYDLNYEEMELSYTMIEDSDELNETERSILEKTIRKIARSIRYYLRNQLVSLGAEVWDATHWVRASPKVSKQ